MPKPKNPRRVVNEIIRDIKRTLFYTATPWTIRMTVFDASANRWRPRRADEKPENHAEAWETLAHNARRLARYSEEMAEFAEAHAKALRQN